MRSSKSADKVKSLVGDAAAVEIVEGDISDPAALAKLVEGPVDALIILTSAVPKPKILSMVWRGMGINIKNRDVLFYSCACALYCALLRDSMYTSTCSCCAQLTDVLHVHSR